MEIEYRDGKIEIEPCSSSHRLVRKGSLLMISATTTEKLTHAQVKKTIQAVRERRD